MSLAGIGVTDFLDAVAQLTPTIVAQRQAIEQDRRLPGALVDAMREAGLFSLWLSEAFGGPQLSVDEFIRVIEAISRADGSTGWCATVGTAYSGFAGYLAEPVAREIYGDGRAILAGTINPSGRAEAASGGFRVTGRWAYGSGIEHSNWALGNCIVFDGEARRSNATAAPSSA
jgi:indole-3-acetate monooxygenase